VRLVIRYKEQQSVIVRLNNARAELCESSSGRRRAALTSAQHGEIGALLQLRP